MPTKLAPAALVAAAVLAMSCSSGSSTGIEASETSSTTGGEAPENSTTSGADDTIAETEQVLQVIPVDQGDLERPSADGDDVLIDSGSTATVALFGRRPVWIGLLGEEAVLRPVDEIAPDLEPRVAPGFNKVAACGSTLVMLVIDPEALVAVDVASGSVVWEVALVDDSPQIACGDADVLVVQEDEVVRGLGVDDGAERWSQPIRPDDPLRLTPSLGLVGSYDGVIAIDLDTGEPTWTLGDSADSVVVPSPAGTLLRLGASHAAVDNGGQGALEIDEDAFDADPWSTFVASAGDDLSVIDPESGTAFDAAGSRSLLSDDVVEVIGAGPDGLIWATVRTERGIGPGLIDTAGQVVAAAEADAPGPDRIALPHLLVLLDAGRAVVASS